MVCNISIRDTRAYLLVQLTVTSTIPHPTWLGMLSSAAAATAALKTETSEADIMHPTMSSMRKNKNRFTDQQIKSLEGTFESDSRPESQTKQQLAVELGLQPRQVAIWFQNKRARSRSKQLEQDYRLLKSRYDTLVSGFESLKTENRSLLIQVPHWI